MAKRTEEQIEISEAAAHLRLAIARTARRLRQESMGREGSDMLTPTMLSALATVDRCGPLTPSELADAERVKRPTATRVLAKLEKAGMIERTPDPADGRSWLVSVTEPGHDYLVRARSRNDALLATKMAELPAADIATLDRAARILEGMLEIEGGRPRTGAGRADRGADDDLRAPKEGGSA